MSEYNEKRRREVRDIVTAIKSGKPCVDCKVPHHPAVMEFDHRPGEEKIDTVSRMVANGLGIRTILNEIAKCDLVCANCHRLRTVKRLETSF